MQDIRVELVDEAPEGDRLAHQEGRHLEPAQGPRPEVLEDRAVGQVLPVPGEVAEAADLQRAGALAARCAADPRHQHDRLEVSCLLLGQVPDETRRPLVTLGREGRGDDEKAGDATAGGQEEPPGAAGGRRDKLRQTGIRILTASARAPLGGRGRR
jgi:hypothetical protein